MKNLFIPFFLKIEKVYKNDFVTSITLTNARNVLNESFGSGTELVTNKPVLDLNTNYENLYYKYYILISSYMISFYHILATFLYHDI